MIKNDEYIIKVNKKTLELISRNLQLVARLKIGQLKSLEEIFEDKIEVYGDLEKQLTEIKKYLFPELDYHSSYGIYNKDCPEDAKIMYDLHRKIRLELDNNYDNTLEASEENFEVLKS